MGKAFRQFVRVLAAAALVVSTAWSPAAIRAGESNAEPAMHFFGQVGCNASSGSVCDDWEHVSPAGAREWTKPDRRDEGGMSAKGNVSFVEQRDAAGRFISVTVTAHLETSISNRGNGRADFYYQLYVEAPSAQLDVTGIVTIAATGSEYIYASTNAEVNVHCDEDDLAVELETIAGGGGSNPMSDTDSESLGARVDTGLDDCSIQVDGAVNAATNREAPGESGRTTVDVAVTVAAAGPPPPCGGLHGTVFDGAAPSAHHNPLPGVRVQLYRDGAPVGEAVATEDDGTYCLQAGDGVQPDDYLARATLVYARHDPPLFETRIYPTTAAAFAEVPVTAADFAVDRTVDIPFVDDAAKPHQSDTANIHWQSTRFVDWLLTVGFTPETLTRFTIVTFDSSSTSSHYSRGTTPPSVHIAAAPAGGVGPGKSTFLARNEPVDNGPENAEWHEIGHHVGAVLGIADIYGEPCDDREPHGGWLNDTTCDSLGEGFAEWIAVAASITIDAGTGPGYGTTFYAMHHDIEVTASRPWTLWPTPSGTLNGDEDAAVASLLWDLADDTPAEAGLLIRAKDADAPNDGSGLFDVPARDRLAIGDAAILRILRERRPQTVVDLFEALKADAALPADANVRDLDLDGDDVADASPLEEAFLMHGFHPVHDLVFPRFVLGDPISRTDRETTLSIGLAVRPETATVPNSWVRFQNGTDTPETFTIDAAFAGGTVSRTVSVPAHSTRLEYVEVPPYYLAVLEPGAALPPCGGADHELITITISAASGGAEPRVLDSCAYWQAIVASTDGSAATYTVGSGPFGSDAAPGSSNAPAAPSPTEPGGIAAATLAIGAAIAVAIALAIVFALRWRGAKSTGKAP
jgi:hypothetical protein